MDIQLYHHEKEFSTQARDILEYLAAMDSHIEEMRSNKTNHMTEILIRQIKQLTPKLNRFRWTCLCVSLPKTFQNHAGDIFQVLERLNWFAKLLQGFDEKSSASTSSTSTATVGEIALLQDAIAVTRKQLAKVTYNLMQNQSAGAALQ
jgi:hypothetical protein